MVKISKTKHVTKNGQVKKNPTKDPTILLKRMLYFEDLSTDYIDSQIKGIINETEPGNTIHDSYLREKVNNSAKFLDTTLENFISRMKIPRYREEFDKKKLPAYTKGTTELLKKVMWFEWLAKDYIDGNINGILIATNPKRTWYDDDYLNEKREYAVRHLRGALENFSQRMKNPKIRAMWDEGRRE